MEFNEIIKKHLDAMASEDESFAKRYSLKTKSLDKCIQYIFHEAKKRAKDNCSAVESDIVFGWAAHYYQEEDSNHESVNAVVTAPKADIKSIKAIVNKHEKEYKELDLFEGF